MDALRFDRLTRGAARLLSRRWSLLALSGAALGTLAAPGPGVEASKTSKKIKRACRKQDPQCQNVVKTFCDRFGADAPACEQDLFPCCHALKSCDAAPATQCFIDNLFMPVHPSDRALKANLASVDPVDMLARVRDLPITTWNYTRDDLAIRHIGPMAQDFAAIFGLGADDRYIHPIDGQGVALAAIQGLITEVERLRHDNAALAARLVALEQAGGSRRGEAARR